MNRLKPLFKVRLQTAFDESGPLLPIVNIAECIAVPNAILSPFLVLCEIVVRLKGTKRQLIGEQLEY